MVNNLRFLAGSKAYEEIRQHGLRPDRVRVVAAAAGGPKWLMLSRMDHVWFGQFFAKRTDPLLLVGSSIGAWRMAVACFDDPLQGFREFENGYINQRYKAKPTKEEINRTIDEVLDALFTAEKTAQILAHPSYQLNVVTARSKGPLASDNPLLLGPGLLVSALANAVSRKNLSLFYERVLFQHPASDNPFYQQDTQPVTRIPLTKENLTPAIAASGAIPMVIEGVRNIPGAPQGSYRDGGVIDYHFDIDFSLDDGLVLLPHFTQRIIPGWFDKSLKYRKPNQGNMERVLMVAASDAYIAGLPRGRIPDRTDFDTYAGRDDDRIAYWSQIVNENQRLADELAEVLEQDRIAELVEPMM